MSKPSNENPAKQPIELSQKDRQKLAVDFMPLVKGLAKKFMNHGLDWDDLVGYGNIGLVYAANKFDPNLGYQFSTYATHCVKWEIFRALDSNSSAHVPIYKVQAVRELIRKYNSLVKQLKREPSINELTSKTGLSSEEVEDLLEAAKAKYASYLDAPIKEGGSTLGSLIPSGLPMPDAEVAEKDSEINRNEIIRLACQHKLSPRDREMLSMKFGILGHNEDGTTLTETGQKFGLSRERVRQIIVKACGKFKKIPEMRQAYEEALAA